MARHLYIAGTGSFAAEIADWAEASGAEIDGLIELEQAERIGSEIHGIEVVALEAPRMGSCAVLGVGGDRRLGWQRLADAGWLAEGIVHPTAHVAGSARVAPSATVGPHCVIGAEAEIGAHVILSRGVLLGHHARVGDFATLNPGANVGGNSETGAGAFLGMGCVVVNGLTIGSGATVAAGSVAIGDVAPGVRVQGTPATPYSSG